MFTIKAIKDYIKPKTATLSDQHRPWIQFFFFRPINLCFFLRINKTYVLLWIVNGVEKFLMFNFWEIIFNGILKNHQECPSKMGRPLRYSRDISTPISHRVYRSPKN